MPSSEHDDDSTSSDLSAVTNLVSQLNDVETAVLTSSAKRNVESNRELLKQLALIKLQLLTDDISRAEHPKSSRSLPRSHSRPSRRGSRGEGSLGGTSRSSNRSRSRGRRPAERPSVWTLDVDMDGSVIEIPCNRTADDTVSALNSSPSVTTGSASSKRNHRRATASGEGKEFANKGNQPDLIKETRKGPERMSTTLWSIFANMVTFLIPDFMICKVGAGAKKAWREKVAIFFIFLLVSAFFVLMVSLVPIYICVESDEYYDVDQVGSKGWNSIFGLVYDLEEFVDLHPGGAATVERYFGLDVSRLFARLPPTELPSYCLSDLLNETVFNETNILGLQDIHCSSTEEELFQYGQASCHLTFAGMDQIDEKLGDFKKGKLVIPGWDIGPTGLRDGTQVIIIDSTVYNVTRYMDGLRCVLYRVESSSCSVSSSFG
jgi:Cytochrome b5-like Heme/Steroid binding domain